MSKKRTNDTDNTLAKILFKSLKSIEEEARSISDGIIVLLAGLGLSALLVALRLDGVVEWGWLWIFSPLWVVGILAFVAFVLLWFVRIVEHKYKKKRERISMIEDHVLRTRGRRLTPSEKDDIWAGKFPESLKEAEK